MARFLIVGEGPNAEALAKALEHEGHVASVVAKPQRDSLAHVAIVVWLSDRSPESFLVAAIDSSMRGFVHEPDRWGREVTETARRNAIPLAVVDGGDDAGEWLSGARVAIASLIEPIGELQ
ncbi:MAG TPA: hypothetical protein VFW38_13470 [Solirubrobacteraceae bacterium]|nr:hypothetical protein [Solirubrobacteraceae bacterium]